MISENEEKQQSSQQHTKNGILNFLMNNPYIIYLSAPAVLSTITSLTSGESLNDALGRMVLNLGTFEGMSSSAIYSLAMIGLPTFMDFCSMTPFFNKTVCMVIYIFMTYITSYVTYNIYRIFGSGLKLGSAKAISQTSRLLKFFSQTSQEFLVSVIEHLQTIDAATGSRRVELASDVINDIQLVFDNNAQQMMGFLMYSIAFSSTDRSVYYNFVNLLSSLIKQDPNNNFYKGLLSNFESTKKFLAGEINKKIDVIRSNLREKVDGVFNYISKSVKKILSKDKELADVIFEDFETKEYYNEDEAIELINNIESKLESKLSDKQLALVKNNLKELQTYKSEIIEYKLQYKQATEYKNAIVGFVDGLSSLSPIQFEQSGAELMSVIGFSQEIGDFFVNPSSLFSELPQETEKKGIIELLKSPFDIMKQLLTTKNPYEKATDQGLKAIDSIIDIFTKSEFVGKTKAWKSFVNKEKTQLLFTKIKNNYKMLMAEGLADYRELVYEKGLELKRAIELQDILPSANMYSQYLEQIPEPVTQIVQQQIYPTIQTVGRYAIPEIKPLFVDIPSTNLSEPDIAEISLPAIVQIAFLVIMMSILLRLFKKPVMAIAKKIKGKKELSVVPLQEQGKFYFEFHKNLA